jgi:1,4-alpha-glucan branching enzyme
VTRDFGADDAWLLAAGTHLKLWEVLGVHLRDGVASVAVWAPNADAVSVLTDGNGWTPGSDPLAPDPSGVWRGLVSGLGVGDRYKFAVRSSSNGRVTAKADPLAFASELPPATASVVGSVTHQWTDTEWMQSRAAAQRWDQPVSVYELHLGSWRFEPGGYRAMARQIADYCVDVGFSHVELMPVTEHPFYGSWGYQTTGYFGPTSRYGSADDFADFVDILHTSGIGVILDWVPSHFPTDEHSLGFFDGTHLYEHEDVRQGFHPDWKSFVFNYGRPEVRSFLLSSAHFWLERFHIDGLRVDAVASMLYLDYSRADGEWIPNEHGGNENIEAIEFLQELNRSVYEFHPDVMMIAEESTAWPGVTRPIEEDGLGFGYKWDMGWMNDTLEYLSHDPVHRTHHHDRITFRAVYASTEHYVLPLSHDEVVHGKGSLLAKMPGDRWQQMANLRLLFGYQWTIPGKKLLFMGSEFASPVEWNHEAELPWALLSEADHAGMQGWVRHLNRIYRSEPSLHRSDRDPASYQWVVGDDQEQSVLAYLRHAEGCRSNLVVMNNTPVARPGYRIGVPVEGSWVVLGNSDDVGYGGSGQRVHSDSTAGVATTDVVAHGAEHSLSLDLPPLAIVVLGAP